MLSNEAATPAEDILKRLAGFQDEIKVFGANVLVAIFVRPEKTRGGIIRPDKVREEDLYQGKVGLVIAMGPLAFVEDPARGVVFPDGCLAELGDWVIVRGSDSWQIRINDVDCRMMSDVAIRGTTPDPEKVY